MSHKAIYQPVNLTSQLYCGSSQAPLHSLFLTSKSYAQIRPITWDTRRRLLYARQLRPQRETLTFCANASTLITVVTQMTSSPSTTTGSLTFKVLSSPATRPQQSTPSKSQTFHLTDRTLPIITPLRARVDSNPTMLPLLVWASRDTRR